MDKYIKVNKDIIDYIENNILEKYKEFESAHNHEHIKYVISRSLVLAKDFDVNMDMVYVIAAYHDIGHKIDKDTHEIISAEILEADENLKKWFTNEQIKIMSQAVLEHRGSNPNEPTTIYGKIVSDADRSIDINMTLTRQYNYAKNHYPEYRFEELAEDCYKHMKEKFGECGYVKLWLNNKETQDIMKEYKKLLSDKEKFIQKLKEVNKIG